MSYVVVGAGAIGGTVGARLARAGHEVLFCDAAAEHVAAMNADGLTLEGPLEQFTVPARAVAPDELPDGLGAVLLAVKHQHTRAALQAIAPRLASDGFVVSLQNGINEPLIAEAVGPERTVGAFVNFGADYLAPGHIHYAGRGTFVVGEPDGRVSERVRALAADLEAEATDNVMGFLWAKEAYGAMLFATAVSDLSIADALASRATASSSWAWRARRWPERRRVPSRSTASTPPTCRDRSSAWSSSTAARPRRTRASTATWPCASARSSRCWTGWAGR
jgi:2-dehydropantoate 2-reductase